MSKSKAKQEWWAHLGRPRRSDALSARRDARQAALGPLAHTKGATVPLKQTQSLWVLSRFVEDEHHFTASTLEAITRHICRQNIKGKNVNAGREETYPASAKPLKEKAVHDQEPMDHIHYRAKGRAAMKKISEDLDHYGLRCCWRPDTTIIRTA